MTLIGPILDDRSYDDLRRELLRRIPTYTSEWTDDNESDPGVVLLELFAHLGETLLFRFNQIPDATKVAFLRLLGQQPRPAQLARSLLVLTTGQPEGVHVPRGTEVRASSVPFGTEDEVHAWPIEVRGVGKTALPDSADPREQARRKDAVARRPKADRDAAAVSGTLFYTTTVLLPDPPQPDAAGLDVSTTADQALWIALLASTRLLAGDQRKALGRGVVYLGVVRDELVPQPFDLQATTAGQGVVTAASAAAEAPPAVLWELWDGPPPAGRPTTFTPLEVVGDTTRGLTTTGIAKLTLPAQLQDLTGRPGDGSWDSPPLLDDPELAARVLGWIRATRPVGETTAVHGVRWVGVNAVSVVQALTAQPELLGTGTGDPARTYPLSKNPVVAGSVRLEVEEVDGWHPWTEVDSFAASRPGDPHFAVDLTAGSVRFGSRSRVPQIGQRIRVVSYRYGGGSAGNVPLGGISSLNGVGGVKVSQVLPAVGGQDAATLDDALQEVPEAIHRRDRAVTADDLRALTMQLQGVRRAETLPLMHPDAPREQTPGAVSVMVFPTEDLAHPSAPTPDLALMRRVATDLDTRRLLTCELYVIPPTYRRIAVAAGVHVRDGYQVDAVRRWVELILRQYLAPVPPYGPDGQGWPLGRAVRRAELEAVAVQVDGVEYLEGLELAELDPTATGPLPTTQLIELEDWEVLELAEVTVVRGMPLPPGEGYPTTGPGSRPDRPVLLPIPPDVC
jgi:hypothetical protein